MKPEKRSVYLFMKVPGKVRSNSQPLSLCNTKHTAASAKGEVDLVMKARFIGDFRDTTDKTT